MSDQLTWLDLKDLDPDPSKTKNQATAKAKKVARMDASVEARINSLIEKKSTPAAPAPPSASMPVRASEPKTVAAPVAAIETPEADDKGRAEPEVLTVSDLNRSIRDLLE